MAKQVRIKRPGRQQPVNSFNRDVNMKYFNLLLSLCLVFMLCSSWVAAQTGALDESGESTFYPGGEETTEGTPVVSTEYPIYGVMN